MILNHSEQDLYDFVSKINNCHDTIKFTFKYSNREANFLDVNIKMKETGELDTSVYEKVSNCLQYYRIKFIFEHNRICRNYLQYFIDLFQRRTPKLLLTLLLFTTLVP